MGTRPDQQRSLEPVVSTLKAMVDQLEEEIVFGRRRPRERLVEDDLVEQFGAKKHVVRQALTDLERMGLVEKIRNKGAMVRDYSPVEVRKIYAVRRLLEAEAARQIALPVSDELLSNLNEVFAVHANAVESADLRCVFRSNIRFHQVLFEACDNPYLAQAIEQFALQTHAIRFYSMTSPELQRKAMEDHRAIIKALKEEDRNKLVNLCIDHLGPSEKAYITAYQKYIGSSG